MSPFRKKHKKLFALLLVFTLLGQELARGQSSIASPLAPTQKPPLLRTIEKYGSLRIFTPSGESQDLAGLLSHPDQKILVYLQDAHGNISVQKNTAHLLKAFANALKITAPWIGLEGTPSGEIDPRALSLFPDRRLRRLAALFFLKNGDLDGAEYYTAVDNPHARLFGVDSAALWAENKKHFTDFKNHGVQTVSFEKISAALATLKRALYHRDLLELDLLFNKDENFAKDLRTLVQIAKAKGISLANFPTVTTLTLPASPGAENPPLDSQDRLIEILWDEVQTLRQKTWAASFSNSEQEKLYAAAEALLPLEKLLTFKAIPQEVEQLSTAPTAKLLQPLQNSLRQYAYLLPKESRPQAEDFAELAATAEKALLFYATARARDHVLAGNLESLMQLNSGRILFFIGGGFHQERLVKQMLSKKISVVVVSPFMVNHEGEKNYWRRLRDQVPSWPLPEFHGGPAASASMHAGSTLKLPSSFPLLGQPGVGRFPWEAAFVLYALAHTSALQKNGAASWATYASRWGKTYPQDSLTGWLPKVHHQTAGWFEYHGRSGAKLVLGITHEKAPRPAGNLASLNRQAHHRLTKALGISLYLSSMRSEMRSNDPPENDATVVGEMHAKEILIQNWPAQEPARNTVAVFLGKIAIALYNDPKFNFKKAPLKAAFNNMFLSVSSKQQNAVYDKFRERYAGVTLETNPIFSELLAYENPAPDETGTKQTPTLKIAPHILTRTLSADAAAASVTLEVLTALLVFWEMVVPILSELKIVAQTKDIHTLVTGIFTDLAKQSGVTQAQFMADLATLSSQGQAADHSDTHFASIIHTSLDLHDQASLMRPLPQLVGNSTIDHLVPKMPDSARLDTPHTTTGTENTAAANPLADYEAALVSSFGTPAPQSLAAAAPAYTILGDKFTIAQNAVITLNGVKYKLIRPLGKGGFGEVWLVQKEGLVKLFYALKVVKPPSSQTTSPEFIRAARRAALEVSSLIRLEEVTGTPKFITQEGLVDETNEPIPGVLTGAAEGLLLMSLATGQTLSKAVTSLRNQGLFLEPKDAATLMHSIVKTVAQAHTQGLTHRDLKPDNVMFRFIRQGHDWQHQILDWGLARDEQTNRDMDIDLGVLRSSLAPAEQLYLDTLTKAGQVFGTPGHIGWNQIQNPHSVTYLDDAFALGGTFYFMVTGGREIYRIGANAPNQLERITRSLQGLYQNPSSHNPALEGSPLEYIILKMLAPPAARNRHDKRQVVRVDARGNELLAYRSDDELLADLNALVEARHLPSANAAGLTGYPDAYTVRILDQDGRTVYDDFIPPPEMLQPSLKSTTDSGSGQSGHSATSQTGTTPKSATSRSRSTTHSLTEFLSRGARQAPTQSIGGGPTLPLVDDVFRNVPWVRRHFWKLVTGVIALFPLSAILFFYLWPLNIKFAEDVPILLKHDQKNVRVELTVNGRPFAQSVTVAAENPGYGETQSMPVQVSVPWHADRKISIPFKRLFPPPKISGIREPYFTKDRKTVAIDLVVNGTPQTIYQPLEGLISGQDGTFEIPVKVRDSQGGEATIKIKVTVDTTLFKWPANYFTLIEGYHEVKNPFEVAVEIGGKKEKKSIQGEIHPLSWLQAQKYIRAEDDISFLSIYKQGVHPNNENGDGKPQFPFFFRDASHTAQNPYTVSWMVVDKPIPVSEKTHFELALDVRVKPKRTDLSNEELVKLGLDPNTYRGSGNILFGLHNPDVSFNNQSGQAEYGKMVLLEVSGMAGNLATTPLFVAPDVPFNLKGGRGDFIRANYAKRQVPDVAVPVNKWQTVTLIKPAAGETYAAPGEDPSKAKTYDGKTALILLEGKVVHTFEITVSPNMRLVLYSSGDTDGAAFGNAKVILEEKKAPAAKRSEMRPTASSMPMLWQRIVPRALAPQASAVLFLPASLINSVTGPNLLPMPNTRLVFVAEPGLSTNEFQKLNTRLKSAQAVLIRSPRSFRELLRRPDELENLKRRAAPALNVRIQSLGTPIFFNPAPLQAPPVRQAANRASEQNFFVLHVDALRLAKDPAYRTAHLVTAAALSKQTLRLLQGLLAYADGSLAIPPSWIASLQHHWQAVQSLAYSA